MPDYLPSRLADYMTWRANYGTQLTASGATYGIAAQDITDTTNNFTALTLANANIESLRAQLDAAIQGRDDLLNSDKQLVRRDVRQLQAAPNMTDPVRALYGITVPGQNQPPGPDAVETMEPPLLSINFGLRQRTIVHAGPNPENERNNAKPAGVKAIRIWFHLGGIPPNEADWVFLLDMTDSPYEHVIGNATAVTIAYRAAYLGGENKLSAPSDPAVVQVTP